MREHVCCTHMSVQFVCLLHMHMHMEVKQGVGCLPYSLSTYGFETGSLTEPELAF